MARCFTSWQAPSFDCYKQLGVPPTSTAAEIKAAYIKKAKSAHPDVSGSAQEGDMTRLNLSYEALTSKRSEYDASRGVGGHGARASAYSANRAGSGASGGGGGPFWRSSTESGRGGGFGASENFGDFGAEWEDLFYGRSWAPNSSSSRSARGSRGGPGRASAARGREDEQSHPNAHGGGKSFREQWDEWEADFEAFSSQRRRPGPGRGKGRRGMQWQDTDSEEDSDSSDDEGGGFGRRGRGKGRVRWERRDGPEADDGHHKHKAARGGAKGGPAEDGRKRGWRAGDPPPAELWVSVPANGKPPGGGPGTWERLAGQYALMPAQMNGRPAYAQEAAAQQRMVFLFWSKKFGDWKLAEHLEDDGSCVAFAEDAKGSAPPWAPSGPRWKLWDPSAKRFVFRRVCIVGGEASSPGAEGADAAADEDDIPWSRPPWEQWSTSDLLTWLRRRKVDVKDCYDRDSILERVVQSAAATAEGADGEGKARRDPKGGKAAGEASRKGGPASAQQQERGGTKQERTAQKGNVRLASRMKTDGTYTKPPTLQRHNTVYGNRVEPFRGLEPDVKAWLKSNGDKARLYGVYIDKEMGYSLVWKPGKFCWERPSFRD